MTPLQTLIETIIKDHYKEDGEKLLTYDCTRPNEVVFEYTYAIDKRGEDKRVEEVVYVTDDLEEFENDVIDLLIKVRRCEIEREKQPSEEDWAGRDATY